MGDVSPTMDVFAAILARLEDLVDEHRAGEHATPDDRCHLCQTGVPSERG